MKNSVRHVQPPAEILAGMLTVRVHLDAVGDDNGPLLVVPGTHLRGIASADDGHANLQSRKVACVTGRGVVVLMRPLLFHASRKATRPSHRRLLHLEFAADELPSPLRWARG